jgi:hypothetical protein
MRALEPFQILFPNPIGAALVFGGMLAFAVIPFACTPEQRAPVRTALEASQCINAIALRHLDAGDDFDDPKTLSVIASEIAVECNPLTKATE